MEKILEKKYFIIGGIVILIGLLGLLYFVVNRSNDGYTNLNETKEEEKKEVSVEKTIVVEVKGEVVNPGVYTLTENSIINDLINQAGGLTENAYTDNINLSKKLKDEMVVIIYKKSVFAKATSKVVSQTSKVTSTTKSNITSDSCVTSTSDITECTDNTKSVIEVEESGSDTSSSVATSTTSESSSTSTSSTPKIININTATLSELMTLKGIGESKAKKIIEYREKTKFTTPQDITKVSGIGTSTYENIKEYITV